MIWSRKGRRFQRDTSGATAVEFALVIGPLLLLVVGTIEAGRLMWTSHALDEVAIAGARCIGIRAPECTSANAATADLAVPFLQQAAQSRGIVLRADGISFDASLGCGAQTGFLRVALTYDFASVLPGLAGTRLETEACFPSQI